MNSRELGHFTGRLHANFTRNIPQELGALTTQTDISAQLDRLQNVLHRSSDGFLRLQEMRTILNTGRGMNFARIAGRVNVLNATLKTVGIEILPKFRQHPNGRNTSYDVVLWYEL